MQFLFLTGGPQFAMRDRSEIGNSKTAHTNTHTKSTTHFLLLVIAVELFVHGVYYYTYKYINTHIFMHTNTNSYFITYLISQLWTGFFYCDYCYCYLFIANQYMNTIWIIAFSGSYNIAIVYIANHMFLRVRRCAGYSCCRYLSFGVF